MPAGAAPQVLPSRHGTMSEDSDREEGDPGAQEKVKGLWSLEVGGCQRRAVG